MNYLAKILRIVFKLAVVVFGFLLMVNTTFLIINLFGYDKYVPIYDTAQWLINLLKLDDAEIAFIARLTMNLMLEVVSISIFLKFLMEVLEEIQFFFSDFHITNISKIDPKSMPYTDLLPQEIAKKIHKGEKGSSPKARAVKAKIKDEQDERQPGFFETLFFKYGKYQKTKEEKDISKEEEKEEKKKEEESEEIMKDAEKILAAQDKKGEGEKTEEKKISNASKAKMLREEADDEFDEDDFSKSLNWKSLFGKGKTKTEDKAKKVVNIE
jgi:hypothetical protein